MLALLPKIKTLAEKEGSSRKAIAEILKVQQINLETYADEDGKCFMIVLCYHKTFYYYVLVCFVYAEKRELEIMYGFQLRMLATMLQMRGRIKILVLFSVSAAVL